MRTLSGAAEAFFAFSLASSGPDCVPLRSILSQAGDLP